MRLYPLALGAALLPLVTIHITYLLSASYGQVDWCIPYIHSCTSISATGREPPAYFVFKGLMIPAAVLLALYWLLSAAWLKTLGCQRHHWRKILVALGLIASTGLVFYTVALGWIDPVYRLQRHIGVSTFFGFSLLAQLLVTWLLESTPAVKTGLATGLRRLKIAIGTVFVTGLASVVIGFVSPDLYRRSDDAFAWSLTLLLCIHTLLTADLWRQAGWRMRFVCNFTTTPPDDRLS